MKRTIFIRTMVEMIAVGGVTLLVACNKPARVEKTGNSSIATRNGSAAAVSSGVLTEAPPARPGEARQVQLDAAAADVQYPKITLSDAEGEDVTTHAFSFEDRPVSISVTVSDALYESAQLTPKYVVSSSRELPADWRYYYNQALIFDDVQASFFKALIDQLRRVKKRRRLDDDRYVELMVTFVQSIAYDEVHGKDPRFPVETFVEQQGDCDDKSRLLVGLLAREGYDVALLHFFEDQHMAAAIAADALRIPGSKYAHIETTSPSMVGFPFAERANVILRSHPYVLQMGTGRKSYNSASSVTYLVDVQQRITEVLQALEPQLTDIEALVDDAQSEVAALEADLKRYSQKDPAAYNKTVDAYNAAVDGFNAHVARQRALSSKMNKLAEVFNYISTHSANRYGTYVWVKEHYRE